MLEFTGNSRNTDQICIEMGNKNFFLSSQKNVMEFLAPLKPVAIRIVRNAHGNKTGEAGAVSGGAGEAGAWTRRLGQSKCGDALRTVMVYPLCGPRLSE